MSRKRSHSIVRSMDGAAIVIGEPSSQDSTDSLIEAMNRIGFGESAPFSTPSRVELIEEDPDDPEVKKAKKARRVLEKEEAQREAERTADLHAHFLTISDAPSAMFVELTDLTIERVSALCIDVIDKKPLELSKALSKVIQSESDKSPENKEYYTNILTSTALQVDSEKLVHESLLDQLNADVAIALAEYNRAYDAHKNQQAIIKVLTRQAVVARSQENRQANDKLLIVLSDRIGHRHLCPCSKCMEI